MNGKMNISMSLFQNRYKVILATIYCLNGNPSIRLFRLINALSNQVIFLGDFNSKHKQFGSVKQNKSGQMIVNIAKDLKLFYVNQLEQFGSVKQNKSGQMIVNIAKDLKLFYVNQLEPKRHTCEDPVHGRPDILDMTFITPGLSYQDISFSVAHDHMNSDHYPIQISLDKPLKWNTPLTEPCYRFDKTNDDLLHNTLKDSLTNIDTNITTQDELEELAVTLCDKLMKAVDTSSPEVYSCNDPKPSLTSSRRNISLGSRTITHMTLTANPPSTGSRKK